MKKKRDQDNAFGVLLLSDIAKNALAHDRAADRVNVYEVMSKPVIAVESDMDVHYCARLFERIGISSPPVIENGVVLGTVSCKERGFVEPCIETGNWYKQ
ncbi:MAG: putative transcriptional regulator [Oceanicoccus sp.]|jgi:predicted transcriptional regulator